MHRRAPGFHPGLMTDMYHPDSAYVSWRTGHNGLTTFDLYTRTAPFGGAYLLVAGLEAALEFVQAFRYTPEELKFLANIRDYDAAFLDELANLRFTGEILALPEGSIVFPNEPIMRVTAPFREALLIEAGLLQAIKLSTLIATKASRIVYAAGQGRPRRVAEFAFRSAQEPLTVARASYIGGCASTSLLNAAYEFRLPATGTVPHALIELFSTEEEAFEAIAAAFNRYTLLLDTTIHARLSIQLSQLLYVPRKPWAIPLQLYDWIAVTSLRIATTSVSNLTGLAWTMYAFWPAVTWTSGRLANLYRREQLSTPLG